MARYIYIISQSFNRSIFPSINCLKNALHALRVRTNIT